MSGDPALCTCLRASWPPWTSSAPADCPIHNPRTFSTIAGGAVPPPQVFPPLPISIMGSSCRAVTAVVERMEESAHSGLLAVEVAANLEQWAADLRVALREDFGPGDVC